MSNMNDEKEKAWQEFKVICREVEHGQAMTFGKGFDAGVKAERERVKHVLTVFKVTMPTKIDSELFPQEQEK